MTKFDDDDMDDAIVIAASSESLTEVTEAIEESKGKTGKKKKGNGVEMPEEADLEWVEPTRNHEAIIDKEGNNSLMLAALDLMNSSSATADSIKAKKVSLDLVQIGIAELQAYRLARIATTAIILEERMYSPENLRELKKASQISDSLSQLNSSMKDALGYIQGTMSRVKFDTIESYLKDIVEGASPEDSPGKNKFTKKAREVLDLIAGGEDFDEILQSIGKDDGEEVPVPLPNEATTESE